MQHKFFTLLKYQCANINATYRLLTNLFWLFIISSIAMPMILASDQISLVAPLFLITSLPLLIISMCSRLFAQDAASGCLDFLLIHYGYLHVVLSKFGAICLFASSVIVISMPIFGILFSMNIAYMVLLMIMCLIISIYTCALCTLASSLEHYFAKSQVLISSIILPLLIPQIILSGIIINQQNWQLIFLAIGSTILVSSIIIMFASMLLKT